jgi:hypothetical protein
VHFSFFFSWVNHKLDPLLLSKGDSLSVAAAREAESTSRITTVQREEEPEKIPRARDTQHKVAAPVKKGKKKNFCGKRRKQENDSPPPLLFIMISFCLPQKKLNRKRKNAESICLAGSYHQIRRISPSLENRKKQLASSFYPVVV